MPATRCHHCNGVITDFRGSRTCINCGRVERHLCPSCKYNLDNIKGEACEPTKLKKGKKAPHRRRRVVK